MVPLGFGFGENVGKGEGAAAPLHGQGGCSRGHRRLNEDGRETGVDGGCMEQRRRSHSGGAREESERWLAAASNSGGSRPFCTAVVVLRAAVAAGRVRWRRGDSRGGGLVTGGRARRSGQQRGYRCG
ncbi:hypothetical protein SESBI_26562 [Sesbania bispinosa]|nr:hypothetical protein SESBI_26562 [Sesbania bispinosa]